MTRPAPGTASRPSPNRRAPWGLHRPAAAGVDLRPGGQDIAGQIPWRRGKRVVYLSCADLAKPKRTATPAQLGALDQANLAWRTCPECGQVSEYYIPRRQGECFDCQYGQVASETVIDRGVARGPRSKTCSR